MISPGFPVHSVASLGQVSREKPDPFAEFWYLFLSTHTHMHTLRSHMWCHYKRPVPTSPLTMVCPKIWRNLKMLYPMTGQPDPKWIKWNRTSIVGANIIIQFHSAEGSEPCIEEGQAENDSSISWFVESNSSGHGAHIAKKTGRWSSLFYQAEANLWLRNFFIHRIHRSTSIH